MTPRAGDPLYVPQAELAMAHTLGAAMKEGDGRLFVPQPFPDGVTGESFRRWTGDGPRLVWIAELLESIVGGPVDLLEIAGLVTSGDKDEADDVVPLYVPRSEMDVVRHIRGVSWDRRRRRYVANKSADFALVHRYLTPAMKAAWIADRNIDTAISALIRAKAMISEEDGESPPEQEL